MRLFVRTLISVVILAALAGCIPPKSKRLEYVEAHPYMSERTKAAIADGKIHIGMTQDQARAAWGRPSDINRSVGPWGVSEQWVYRRAYGGGQYLYFKNGILESFQD